MSHPYCQEHDQPLEWCAHYRVAQLIKVEGPLFTGQEAPEGWVTDWYTADGCFLSNGYERPSGAAYYRHRRQLTGYPPCPIHWPQQWVGSCPDCVRAWQAR
jgi:hypothetical protein